MSRDLLPAGPFAAWFTRQCVTHGRESVRVRCQMSGDALLAVEALAPGDHVLLESVDKYLIRMDTGDTLACLYPDLDTPRGRKDLGRSYVCDEQLLIRAHSMHMDGMSARAVAREIFDDCYSASPVALAVALLSAWHGRGWEVRSRGEATAMANAARGWRPQCQHVHRIGEHRGDRCARRCVSNDQWCSRHHPDTIARGLARLRDFQEQAAA